MLFTDTEIKERIESPDNLMNRLRELSKSPAKILSLPPKVEDIVEDLEDKLKVNGLKGKAVNVINQALDELQLRVREINKPEVLAKVAGEMNKIITSESSKGNTTNNQWIVYAPQVRGEDSYEVLDISNRETN